MKGLLGFFLLAFFICACLGYRNGAQDAADPNYLKERILDGIEPIHSADTYFLRRSCDGVETHVFNVETNSLTVGPETVVQETYRPRMSLMPSVKPEMVVGLLGGAAGGVSYKSALSMIKEGKKGRAAAAVAGALCGYSVGYWLAVPRDPPCGSTPVATLLDSAEEWQWFESELYKRHWSDIWNAAGELADPKKADLWRHGLRIGGSYVKSRNWNVRSDDFQMLAVIASEIYVLPKRPARESTADRVFRWVFGIVLGFGALALAAIFLSSVFKKADTPQVPEHPVAIPPPDGGE